MLVLEALVLVHIILTTCTISVAVLNSNSSTLGNTVPFCLQAAGCVQYVSDTHLCLSHYHTVYYCSTLVHWALGTGHWALGTGHEYNREWYSSSTTTYLCDEDLVSALSTIVCDLQICCLYLPLQVSSVLSTADSVILHGLMMLT